MLHDLPDLILSDINMPRWGGHELLPLIRQHFPSVRIVAMSGEFFSGGYPEWCTRTCLTKVEIPPHGFPYHIGDHLLVRTLSVAINSVARSAQVYRLAASRYQNQLLVVREDNKQEIQLR